MTYELYWPARNLNFDTSGWLADLDSGMRRGYAAGTPRNGDFLERKYKIKRAGFLNRRWRQSLAQEGRIKFHKLFVAPFLRRQPAGNTQTTLSEQRGFSCPQLLFRCRGAGADPILAR